MTELITWAHKAYGFEGTLLKMNRDRNDILLPNKQRLAADKAHAKITRQLHDKQLMSMRERLIKASQAGDETEIKRLTQQIRSHNKEDLETGLY